MHADHQSDSRSTRRTLLQAGAAATAAGVLGSLALPAVQVRARDGMEFGSPAYDAALNAKGGSKAVFQSPHYDATVGAGKFVNHLLLVQLKNWLNSFQFSYDIAPTDLHIVVATYASANLLTYGDAVWAKYKLGEKYKIVDPATGQPAVRNLFWPSRFGPKAPRDLTSANSYYQDSGIAVLQERGTIFLTCNNSLLGHAAAAIADGRAPAGQDLAYVVEDIRANLIPHAVLVPAVVGEVSRTMAAGYSLVFIPIFSL